MAEFQPRFVDLVRSYTSTQGTGNFVLGPTVSGFTGFGSVLQVGDSFYYSAIGIDKPAEREVGRGTLTAGGQIARQPLSGSPTNFTNGTKSIALIAPAEWFNNVQAGAGSAPAMAASRAALAASSSQAAAVLTEHRREGLFLFDSSNLSAAVAADNRQGVYVAPASAPSGSSGAWVRRFDGPVYPEWFGAVGDGTSDDQPAIQAAINFQVAAGGGTVRLAAKQYFCGSALAWSGASISLEGGGSGVQSTGGTIVSFPAGLSGAVNIRNGAQGLGAGSVIRALRLKGAGAAAVSDANAALGVGCGILLQSNGCRIEDVVVQGFEGNGVYLLSGVTAPDVSINANNCTIDGLHVWDNRKNGFATYGLDSNHVQIRGLDSTNSGQFGAFENSALGNIYYGPHFAGNSAGPMRFGNMTGYNRVLGAYKEVGSALLVQFDNGGAGKNHVEFHAAEATIADPATFTISDNTTSKDNDVSVLGVRRRAAFGGDGANGTFVISEDILLVRKGKQIQLQDEPLTANWCIGNYGGAAGFSHPSGTYWLMTGDGPTVLGDNGNLGVAGNISATGTVTASNLSGTNTGDQTISLTGDVTGSGTGSFVANIAASAVTSSKLANSAVTYAKIQNVSATAKLLGRASAGAGSVEELGLSSGLILSGTSLSLGAITPTSVAATAAVTSSGATSGVGYAAGAGGAVTQATSKSTGVTINKAAGQITMNAASLAAGGIVSFVVTNSAVAATDTINLNLASGNAAAGAYRYWVEGIAAGSFKIVVENRSAGALAEALVLNFAVLKAVNA